MSFETALREDAARIADCLRQEMSGFGTEPVAEAMRYATSGGKRLRGFLVLEGARVHGVSPERAVFAAAAIECMHAYSLVHDDLPAMDDDDLRRGLPTVHVKWDEATAILVGDALQSLAYQLLANPELSDDHAIRLRLIGDLAQASGARGMVLGQALDMAAERAQTPLTLEEITRLQACKTGALICWSAEAGAALGGADTGAMRRYAEAVGLAFQIADDILDIEGDAERAGKRLRKDAEAGKATFVSLLGLDGAKGKATALVSEANSALSVYGPEADNLRALARFVIARDV